MLVRVSVHSLFAIGCIVLVEGQTDKGNWPNGLTFVSHAINRNDASANSYEYSLVRVLAHASVTWIIG